MKVLVTGATGLVGNNVVRLLLENEVPVRALVRATADPRPLAGLDVDIVEGDVCDARSVAEACRGVDAILHAAGFVQIGWTGLSTFTAINVEGTRQIAEAARAAGCRMVYVSTINTIGVSSRERPADEQWSAGPNIRCPYVVTKQQAEEVVMEYAARGLDAVIVNPALMFGPWDWKPSSGRLLLEVAKLAVTVSPPGGSSVCDVRDVAQGILLALKRT
jgi:dihydroflavonol-4-reductase